MKKTIKNIGNWVKTHKWQTGVCASVLVLAIGVGGIGIASANQAAKEANTKALLEMAEENGVISAEDIENAGDLADLGTEIETDEGTVVITQDENGNIVTTLVKDKDGNSTGAVVPSSGGESSGGSAGGGSVGHTHNWVAHYATGVKDVTTPVYHPAVTQQVLVHGAGYICNQCGAFIEAGCAGQHAATYGHGGTHSCGPEYKTVTVQEAYTENVTTQESYQYVDYYYCSECGARQ